MTELTTAFRPATESAASPAPTPATAVEEPALITEQQVLFGTAAAVALPPAKTRRWTDTIESVTVAVRALFAGPQKPVRRDYPKRYMYLENALMAREMDRL